MKLFRVLVVTLVACMLSVVPAGMAFAVEGDLDDDGAADASDNCPFHDNGPAQGPNNQTDTDNDGIGDVCDGFDNLDFDNDGVGNDVDNCPFEADADQGDADGDGIGDACDLIDNNDLDGDAVSNSLDNCPFDSNVSQADVDDDGRGDVCDRDHARSLSIGFSKHLTVKGVLSTSGGYQPCIGGRAVAVQRYSGGAWRTIKTVTSTSTGAYSAKVTDRTGKYRATTANVVLAGSNRCRPAMSAIKRHSH